MVMNGRIDHFRTDMTAKLPDDKHPETVSKQRQRNHSQAQHCPFPRTSQKKMRGDQARDEQHQGRMDAAAFGRNFQVYARQLKHQPVLKKWRAG